MQVQLRPSTSKPLDGGDGTAGEVEPRGSECCRRCEWPALRPEGPPLEGVLSAPSLIAGVLANLAVAVWAAKLAHTKAPEPDHVATDHVARRGDGRRQLATTALVQRDRRGLMLPARRPRTPSGSQLHGRAAATASQLMARAASKVLQPAPPAHSAAAGPAEQPLALRNYRRNCTPMTIPCKPVIRTAANSGHKLFSM